MKWVSIIAAIIVIVSCFFPWVVIESKDIVISGVDAGGTNYGKPGYANIFFTTVSMFFFFIPRVWTRIICIVFAVLNLAWTASNVFFKLAKCEAGICPDRQPALFIVFIAALVLIIGVLSTPLPIKQSQEQVK